MKTILFWLGLIVTTTVGTWMVQQKEHILSDGRTVLLALRPRDPRSLMQGDYMALRYELDQKVPKEKLQRRGKLVVKVDADHVGTFARLHDSTPLAQDEQLIEYRNYGELEIGAESYFFEEGTGHTFDRAKFAELKISAGGECLLKALCDEQRAVLVADEVR